MTTEARPCGLVHSEAGNDDTPAESNTDSLPTIPQDTDDRTSTSTEIPSVSTSDIASSTDVSATAMTTPVWLLLL
jgi:hypothetical protein